MYARTQFTTEEPPVSAEQTNGHELFLWRNDALSQRDHRGWYITRSVVIEDWDNEGNIIAWIRSVPQEPQTPPIGFPIHVPYWAKKADQSIGMQAFTELSESKMLLLDSAENLLTGLILSQRRDDQPAFEEIVNSVFTQFPNIQAAVDL